MKVLIYGGGAREHALAWKVSQSPLLEKLYLARPNDGFSELGEIIDFTDFGDLADKAYQRGVNLFIVGPEQPLVEGLADVFNEVDIPVIGVNKRWARLEGSKSFAKTFMKRNGIATADYSVISDLSCINQVLEGFSLPVVIKADGLAAGKGVVIAKTQEEAKETLIEFLKGKYSNASKQVVVEEFLTGKELSIISLWDGKTLLPLVPTRDHKRLLEDDLGPNTGGMGAFCPVKLDNFTLSELDNYAKTLERALKDENADFTGVIYSGLMLTNDGIKVLEYNMRFGDPECQPILCHMKSDILEVFKDMIQRKLDSTKIEWHDGVSFCVVAAAEGYPEKPKKGDKLVEQTDIKAKYGVEVFYAGVKRDDGVLLTNGGRVFSVCKTSINPKKDVYNAIDALKFKGMHYRKDIGKDL